MTTPDINIGFVTTLQDSCGNIYGVVGIDVTLINLTDYIAGCKVGRNGRIILTKSDGLIVAFWNKELLFKPAKELLGENESDIINSDGGRIIYREGNKNHFLFFRTNTELGFKIGVIIPEEQINAEIKYAVFPTILHILAAMAFVGLILLIGLRQFVLKPLKKLTEKTSEISSTGDLTRSVDIRTSDEFGKLAISFNAMIHNLNETQQALAKTEAELRKHRDNLEELVKKRTAELEESREEALHAMTEALRERQIAEEAASKLAESYTKLEKLEKLRDHLTNMIIHDMRSPLLAISMSLELISSGDADASAKDLAYKAIKCSTNELINMVDTLLDITQLENGQMPVNRSRCDILTIASESKYSMHSLAAAKNIEILITCEHTYAYADKDLLKRIFMNLLNNAIKFSHTGGKIEIHAYPEENWIKVEVRDYGPGIPKEHLELIFEKFRHFELAEQAKMKSTGLGLTFCKMAVEAHGGKIGAISEPGKGATFWFTLPAFDENMNNLDIG